MRFREKDLGQIVLLLVMSVEMSEDGLATQRHEPWMTMTCQATGRRG
jgi:hypothetical protein